MARRSGACLGALLLSLAILVTPKVNLRGMVEDILQVQPQTTNIVVVFGASALERFWVNEFHRELQPFTNRVGFTWLNDLSWERVKTTPTVLEAETRQKRCNFMMTLLLFGDCVLDHRRGEAHFADFGANQS